MLFLTDDFVRTKSENIIQSFYLHVWFYRDTPYIPIDFFLNEPTGSIADFQLALVDFQLVFKIIV